jgi:hypothetical protein
VGVVVVGCGGSSLPALKTYDVKGKVVVKSPSQVMTAGSVELESTSNAQQNCTGQIQPDGSFTLVTFNGNQRLTGVAEGEYRVTINGPQDANQTPRSVVYARTIKIDPQTTDVTIELDKLP